MMVSETDLYIYIYTYMVSKGEMVGYSLYIVTVLYRIIIDDGFYRGNNPLFWPNSSAA